MEVPVFLFMNKIASDRVENVDTFVQIQRLLRPTLPVLGSAPTFVEIMV